jgi:hypothetical protein
MSTYTAFRGHSRIAHGDLAHVAVAMRRLADRGDAALVLLFEEETGRQIDVDLRGSVQEIAQRFGREAHGAANAEPGARKRGRPKLGVVGREITLLPRHWEWLESQPRGSSATLRRLVDAARSAGAEKDRARRAQDAINRFISAVAGNLAGFEEANRALFRADRENFEARIADWPVDIRKQIGFWADAAFEIETPPDGAGDRS